MSLFALPEGLTNMVLTRLSLDKLMRMTVINKSLRDRIEKKDFWIDLQNRSQTIYRELLINVARLGWAKLWTLLSEGGFGKMKERVIVWESYHQAVYNDDQKMIDALIRVDPTLEGRPGEWITRWLGRLSRALKHGTIREIADILVYIIDEVGNEGENIVIYELARSAPNLLIIEKATSLLPPSWLPSNILRSDMLLTFLLRSDNYPLLIEYDETIGIDWERIGDNSLFASRDPRVIGSIFNKLGIEKITPRVLKKRGSKIGNRRLLSEYLKDYPDEDIILASWRVLSDDELIAWLPRLQSGTIKEIREQTEEDGYDYLSLSIDKYLRR